MAQVAWTDEAERRLRDIFDYIAEDSPGAARKTVQGIVAKAALLGRFSELGCRYDQRDERDVRILLCGHCRIAYLINTAASDSQSLRTWSFRVTKVAVHNSYSPRLISCSNSLSVPSTSSNVVGSERYISRMAS